MYLLEELNVFPLLLLLALWWLSGDLLLQKFFKTNEIERVPMAFGTGLVLNTFSANLLGRFIATDVLFWITAIGWVFIALAAHWRNYQAIKAPTKQSLTALISLAALTILFTLIGRGFGFFDDHQNLPPLSMMAAGDIPPRFAFDPSLMFGYHYWLLLVGAGFVRIAGTMPWVALDLARGLTLALTLSLGGALAYRLTGSRIAKFLSILVIAFAGGARWILLLIPASWLNQISTSVTLIGSGADSGPNLRTAIFKVWNIEGIGEVGLPFMYGSGLDPSFSMFHNGWGTSAIMLILLLFLLAGHAKPTWKTAIFFIISLSALALANEVTFVFLYIGFTLAILAKMIAERSILKSVSDPTLRIIFGIFVISGLISLFQGGMLTEIFKGILSPAAPSEKDTYFRVSFSLTQPAFLSAHLGTLRLFEPKHWLPILAETGFIIFALPITLNHVRGAIKDGNWFKAAWILSILPSLAMLFFEYTGNAGPTAISRMQAHFLSVIKLLAVPLVWIWLKNRAEELRSFAFGFGLVTIFSGLAMFGVQMTAMPKPVSAIFLGPVDTKMFAAYWNTLDPNGMVFDPVYPRGVTILGIPTRSSITMGENLPEWKALREDPDPYALKAAGYDHLYADLEYYQSNRSLLDNACVLVVDKRAVKSGPVANGRILLNLSKCTQ